MAWDILLFLFLLVGGLLYGLLVGRNRVMTVLLSVYVALAVVSHAPILAALEGWLQINQNSSFQLVWFVGFFLLIFFFLWRSAYLRDLGQERHSHWLGMAFGVLQVGLMLSVFLLFLPPSLADQLSPSTKLIFMSEVGRSFWLITPIVILAMGKPMEEEEDED